MFDWAEQMVEVYKISKWDEVKNHFDLSLAGIINYLKLKQPIYHQTAKFGHFGKFDYEWEKSLSFK